MTKKEIEQDIAKTYHKASHQIETALNQVTEPAENATSEAAQEKFQASLTAFNTTLKDGVAHSNCESAEAKDE